MPVLNYTSKEITVKIVYYGPALSGKTTNVKKISERLPQERKGKMVTLPTKEDRTLFFDFLPFSLGTKTDYKVRIQLYTVPGQVFYESTRRLVLQGADGVVFVADSQKELLENNLESLESMKKNLKLNGLNYNTIPLVLQYNKRDLPNILSIQKLDSALNELGRPSFPSIAIKGEGVLETLFAITESTLNSLKNKYSILNDMDVPSLVDDLKKCFSKPPTPESPFDLDEAPLKKEFLGFQESTLVKEVKEEETPLPEEDIIEFEEEEQMPEEDLVEEPVVSAKRDEPTDAYKKADIFGDFMGSRQGDMPTTKQETLSSELELEEKPPEPIPEEKRVTEKLKTPEPLNELLPEEPPEPPHTVSPARDRKISITVSPGEHEIPIRVKLENGQIIELKLKIKIEITGK